jgi:hypothetical protein
MSSPLIKASLSWINRDFIKTTWTLQSVKPQLNIYTRNFKTTDNYLTNL